MKINKVILFLILISLPIISFAWENEYDGLVSGGTNDLFVYFIKMAISAGVIMAVLVIMYHGINMIIAQGEMAKIIMAKERIKAVFVGLLILLGVYVIASTINPDLVIVRIDKRGVAFEIFGSPKDKTDPNVLKFEEIPFGTIVEKILAAYSSKRIQGANDITEELCYSYDENGDTIDRNGDGKITEDDTLRGVDMFYCMEELNQAIIKKVKALNADYLCKGENVNGPIREILKLIQEKAEDGKYNCDCGRCATHPMLQDPFFSCRTETIECCYSNEDGETCVNQDICNSRCNCCGSAYYKPNFACQLFSDSEKYDPCLKSVRDEIDCKRNEIKIRIDGESYDDLPPGATIDNCTFTALWEDPNRDKEKFLTLNLAIERMETFEKYYQNRLKDLDGAINRMRTPYGERISMAELQSLKNKESQDKRIEVDQYQVSINGQAFIYDPVKYCRDFNCTNSQNNVCISGERAELTSFLYLEELKNDPCTVENGNCNVYNSEKENYEELKEKRICNVEITQNKENYSYAGDGATFYYSKGFKYEETYGKEALRMITDKDDKEYMESLIPLGEIVNEAKEFTNKLFQFTEAIKEEVESVKIKAMEFADLSGQCDCLGCINHPTSGGPEGSESCKNFSGSCPNNSCDDCSTCYGKGQGKCICCEECETIKVIDTAVYHCTETGDVTGTWTKNMAYLDFNSYMQIINIPCTLAATDGSNNLTKNLDYVLSHSFYVNGNYCGCPGSETNYYINNACLENISGGNAPGIVCTEGEVIKIKNGGWGQYGNQYLENGTWCSCTTKTGSGICHNPITGIPLNCTAGQLYSSFAKGSDCYNIIMNKFPKWCYETAQNISDTPFWSVSSCQKIGDKTIVKLTPNRTKEITICEGEEATEGVTEEVRKEIENINPNRTIEWIENDKLTYQNLNCCDVYRGSEYDTESLFKQLINLPADFSGTCFYEGGKSVIRVTKSKSSGNNDLSDRGKTVSTDYYACPYNSLKDKQCRIFKYSSIFEVENYPENLVSGLDCTNEKSHGVGHLQKIELLARRIDSYGKGENLKPDDPNRWTTLDLLNYSRKKLDQCITGYGLPLKQGTKSYTLLSCEEGLDTLSSGSATILPVFPYPPSDTMWNCQPYNSSRLTANERLACLNNKQHPICTNAIYNLIDDYYCLQKQ